jgi:methyl-accepting chemotaxis protein
MNGLREERGLAGAMLIIVIVWALLAVFLLTRTLISAQQIDDRVVKITREVQPIDVELDAVRLAETTNAVAKEILTAAKPLSGQLDQVIATKIPESAAGILDTAGKINQTVLAINKTVQGINATIGPIGTTVGSINANVASIERNVDSIEANALSINRNAREILGDTGGILNTSRSINQGVEDINKRADVVIVLVRAIRSNTQDVSNVVPSIDEHANEIDCAFLIKTMADLQTLLKEEGSECELNHR